MTRLYDRLTTFAFIFIAFNGYWYIYLDEMLRPDWTDQPQPQPEQQNRGARRGERDCFVVAFCIFGGVCATVTLDDKH